MRLRSGQDHFPELSEPLNLGTVLESYMASHDGLKYTPELGVLEALRSDAELLRRDVHNRNVRFPL